MCQTKTVIAPTARQIQHKTGRCKIINKANSTTETIHPMQRNLFADLRFISISSLEFRRMRSFRHTRKIKQFIIHHHHGFFHYKKTALCCGRVPQTVDKVGFCHCEQTACLPTFLPENGFPRQCAHWLGMTRFELCLHIAALCCGRVPCGFWGLLCTNDSIYKNQFSIIIKPVMIISIFIIFARVSIF